MKQALLMFLAGAVLSGLCMPDAWAGVTCQIVPAMCPPPPNGGVGPNAVPEPATLALLVAGTAAVGAALRGRRNKR